MAVLAQQCVVGPAHALGIMHNAVVQQGDLFDGPCQFHLDFVNPLLKQAMGSSSCLVHLAARAPAALVLGSKYNFIWYWYSLLCANSRNRPEQQE